LNIPFMRAALLFIALLTLAVPALAQEPYFRGKTIRIVVGFSAGGGYDVFKGAAADRRHGARLVDG
jgi:tripartite-type tricarboxylate transporter receptor subunit TctC